MKKQVSVFMQEIMERSVFDSTKCLEKTNTMWNGIIINAEDEKSCNILIGFLEEIQDKTGLKITSDYVKTISAGEMIQGAAGGYDFKTNTIKILYKPILFKHPLIYTSFIHEFCHAIDEKHNIYLEYEDLYREYANKSNIDLIKDDSNPHKLYADFNEEQFKQASEGNMKLYRMLSIKEFTAVALQNVFDDFFLSEEDIKLKSKELIEKYL